MTDKKTEEQATPAPTAKSAFASLGKYTPKAADDQPVISPEIQKEIDEVGVANGFLSRKAKEPKAQASSRPRFNAAEPKKQLNIKIPVSMHDEYYEMARERGISKLHELLGMALAALKAQDKKGE